MSGYAQLIIVQQITNLDNSIEETSGLLYLNGRIITHNDKGDDAKLYELDSLTGNVLRTVVVDSATNVDWEDLAMDDYYIYIADIGNNDGSRTDQKIYKIPIADYLGTPNDTVQADTISFSFADQTNFVPANFATNWDAETLISFGDSLYVFTKNWNNFRSNIYPLPKIPGSYALTKVDSFDAQGMITGGAYDAVSNDVLLCGYTLTKAFVTRLSGFTGNKFASASLERYELSLSGSIQVEALVPLSAGKYYLSNEERDGNSARLLSIKDNNFVDVSEMFATNISAWPNPTSGQINLDFGAASSSQFIELVNALGEVIIVESVVGVPQLALDFTAQKSGMYWLRISSDTHMEVLRIVKI